jgi:hypothetical protein
MKTIYFSDRPEAQYGNRRNLNSHCTNRTAIVSGEWNFFATSHGKNAWDSLDGNVKDCPYSDQTATPRQLFNWIF